MLSYIKRVLRVFYLLSEIGLVCVHVNVYLYLYLNVCLISVLVNECQHVVVSLKEHVGFTGLCVFLLACKKAFILRFSIINMI